MTKRYTIPLVFVVLCCVAFVSADNFVNIAQQVSRFQDVSGPFFNSFGEDPSLQASADALFLASTYGSLSKINTIAVLEYVETLRTNTNGFSRVRGASADAEATMNAVLCFTYSQSVPSNPELITNYVLSLLDSSSMLFARSTGGSGNLMSTYHAINTLRALNTLDQVPSEVVSRLGGFLQGLLTEGRFEYPGLSPLQATYYSLYIATSFNQIKLSGVEDVAPFVVGQQSRPGFFADYHSGFFALGSLELLEKITTDDYVNQINGEALYQFVKNVPVDLSSTAAAHKSLMFTSIFGDFFKFVTDFGTPSRSTQVVQGTPLLPEVFVRALGGPSHSGFDVTLTYFYEDGSTYTTDLLWDNERQKYTSEQPIDTTNFIGTISFRFELNLNIYEVGVITFEQKTERFVGYGLTVVPTATHTTGRTILEGESVTAGTDFQFDVKVFNSSVRNLKAGDFGVEMNLFDSSNALIANEQITAVGNDAAFEFSYSLREMSYPQGEFSFSFAVTDPEGNPRTVETVVYELSGNMVATDIDISGGSDNTFSVGNTIKVQITPANFAEGKTVPLTDTNAKGESIGNQRHYFMDITPRGSNVVLQSVPALNQAGVCKFEYPIATDFSSLGPLSLSFRYQSFTGKTVFLDNFDSLEKELSQEPLEVEVDADLSLEIIEQPSTTNFFYGNEITFRVRVTDKTSGSVLNVGRRGGVFLTLSHRDERRDRTFVSTKQAAVQQDGELVISWEINPNAVSGPGTLSIIAEGAASEIPLAVNGKPFTLPVTIGGDIRETHSVFTTTDFFTLRTAFVLEFGLSCNSVALKNVKLKAVVSVNGEEVETVPVGLNSDRYVASWATAHTESPSGVYRVDVYREADQARAAEEQEWKQKQLRQKRQEASIAGTPFNEEEFLASLGDVSVQPLFSVDIPHKEVRRGGLPVRIEVFIGAILLASYLYMDWQKLKINKPRA